MREHPLRQKLLDEVHARTFSDFNGAGRFIRFVYLTERGDDQAIIDHVNTYLSAQGQDEISASSKFLQSDFGNFRLRIERHTEFVSVSMIEDGKTVKSGLAKNAFDKTQLSYLPFQFIDQMPADLFHAIWLEVGGKPPLRF